MCFFRLLEEKADPSIPLYVLPLYSLLAPEQQAKVNLFLLPLFELLFFMFAIDAFYVDKNIALLSFPKGLSHLFVGIPSLN